MLNRFKLQLEKQWPYLTDKQLFLAVSGGADSVALFHLFLMAGYSFEVLHCNFMLRGNDSMQDETFVQRLAKENNIKFHCKRFNTEDFAHENGLSIQMAARELRLQWFTEIKQKYPCDFIALAHHATDDIETFILQLVRGSGLNGLHGMESTHQFLIRPLLFAFREEIETFLTQNHFNWREDHSNSGDDYLRNRVRHHVLPAIQKIHPDALTGWKQSLEHLKENRLIYIETLDKIRNQILKKTDDGYSISVEEILNLSFPKICLFEILHSFGFNANQCNDLFSNLEQSGRLFYAKNYRLLVHRGHIILKFMVSEDTYPISIQQKSGKIDTPIALSWKVLPGSPSYVIPREAHVACLDLDTLEFPLKLRIWKKGDYFYPLGMNTSKKISDFLIDTHTSLFEKENVRVLCSKGEICWVVGRRIDQRYKVKNSTTRVLFLEVNARTEDQPLGLSTESGPDPK